MDTPLNNPNSWFSITLFWVDILFTVLFSFEAIFKILALGFFHNGLPGIKPYILNWWNLLDFIVVVASVADLAMLVVLGGDGAVANLSSLKALRALRAL